MYYACNTAPGTVTAPLPRDAIKNQLYLFPNLHPWPGLGSSWNYSVVCQRSGQRYSNLCNSMGSSTRTLHKSRASHQVWSMVTKAIHSQHGRCHVDHRIRRNSQALTCFSSRGEPDQVHASFCPPIRQKPSSSKIVVSSVPDWAVVPFSLVTWARKMQLSPFPHKECWANYSQSPRALRYRYMATKNASMTNPNPAHSKRALPPERLT
jgi:hypothetical protein